MNTDIRQITAHLSLGQAGLLPTHVFNSAAATTAAAVDPRRMTQSLDFTSLQRGRRQQQQQQPTSPNDYSRALDALDVARGGMNNGGGMNMGGGGFGGGEMGYGMMPLFDENDVPPPPPYTPVQPREGRGGGGGGDGAIRASDAMVEEEEEKKLRLLAEAVQRKTGKIHATLAAGNEQEVMEEQSRTSSVGNMDGSQQILSDLPQTLAGAADHISER